MFTRIALALALAALPFLPARAASFAYTTPPAAIKKNYGKQAFRFGYLTVPEDHAAPFGRQIRLAVVILEAKRSGAGLPVFFLTGGPGGSSTSDAPYFDVFDALQKRHDVVLIDQRGTGYSAPFLGIEAGSSYSQAREGFVNDGVNLSAYNTTQNAADIAALRVALGYPQIILFGNSYGTFLAQEVMRNHPAGIAAVVMNGILPPRNTFIPDYNANALHALDELFKDVRRNGPARRAFPNFERTYFALLKELKRGPIEIGRDFKVTLDQFQSAVRARLQSTNRIATIPLIVREVAARRDSAWLRKRFKFVSGPRDFADGMYFSTLGADWNEPDWLRLTREANARLEPPIFRATNGPSSLSLVFITQFWGVPYRPLATRTPLASDIPTLLLSGQMEAQTPAGGGDEVAATLSHCYNLHFPRSGHITGFEAGPPMSALIQFVNDPSRRPAYSLAALRRHNFYLTEIPRTTKRDLDGERDEKFMR